MSASARAGHVAAEPPLRGWFWMSVLVIGLFSLWMRAAFPVHVIVDAAYDDGLFQKLAHSIGAGQWLGPYDNLTLAKGPFYPIFILAAFGSHVPLKIAEQFVYLCGAAVVAWCIARAGAARLWLGLGLMVFALLALNPVLWHEQLARVIREGLYIGECTAMLGLAALIGFPARARPGLAATLLAGLVLGITFGGYWLTREEGPWLLPALGVVLAAAAARAALGWHGAAEATARGLARWRAGVLAAGLGAAVLGGVAVLGTVSTLNRIDYGTSALNEFKSASFRHAVGALERIEPAHWQRYVVFAADARAKAYAVSPAARELAPTLDGPFGREWAAERCVEFGIDPCSGVHAGWFLFVLREAVARAGHYGTAIEARDYYRRLAAEIDAACAEGRLACLPARATLAPPFRWGYVGDALREARKQFGIILPLAGDWVGIALSEGSAAGIAQVAAFVGTAAPSAAQVRQPGRLERLQVRLARGIGAAFAWVFPCAWLLGIPGVLASLLWRGQARPPFALQVLAVASYVAVLSRVALLSYLQVTSIPGTNLLYLSPASPFVIVSGVLGVALGLQTGLWRLKHRSAPRGALSAACAK